MYSTICYIGIDYAFMHNIFRDIVTFRMIYANHISKKYVSDN